MRKIPACREIIRLASLGCSDKKISEITGAARVTVKKIREKSTQDGLLWPLEDTIYDEMIYYTLFPPKEYVCKKKKPDTELLQSALVNEVVKSDLYDTYSQQCIANGDTPVKYSGFCDLVRKEEKNCRMTMDSKSKPGEVLIVFWMESSIKLAGEKNGKAYIFMGIMPYSQNVFVYAYKDRGVRTWIKAHSEMFACFDGVPKEIMIRGMRSGISRCVTDMMYVQMIEYYGIIRTKDSKKKFESEIIEVETWFQEKLDGKAFDSIQYLNEFLKVCKDEFLHELVKGEKTREQVFMKVEKSYLRKLPKEIYYARTRKTAQIQRNCHVVFEKRYYSVPYQFLLQGNTTVELEVTSKKISIYYNDEVIAEHPNLANIKDKYASTYSTFIGHMPSDEQEQSLAWNKELFLKKADRIGKNTRRVIEAVMNSKPIRQQTYRVCDLILRLGTEYGYAKLEAECSKIKYIKNGSVYKTIADALNQSDKYKKGG